MGRILLRTALVFASLLMAAAAWAGARQWESVDRLPLQAYERQLSQSADDGFLLTMADGYVYLAIQKRLNVKMFTILGQPVVDQNLEAGVYRFRPAARGIYILKIGTQTRRVTF